VQNTVRREIEQNGRIRHCRVRASQTLLTIGQFCEPLAVWAFQVIPVNQNSYELNPFGRFLLNN
jgi:hypothetical protein